MDIVVKGEKVLVISENGYGKRTNIEEYKLQNRGGRGLITYKLTEKTGKVVGATICKDDDEIMLINSNGVAIRVNVADISITSRATMGVKVMRTLENESVVAIAKISGADKDVENETTLSNNEVASE